MYKVIGSDGKEYGPVSLEQLTQWATQGRINPQTQVQAVGTVGFRPAREVPEVNALFGAPVSGAMSADLDAQTLLAASAGPPQNGLAITSLVLGILSCVACFFTGIPAIICGHIAYSRSRRSPAQHGGGGMAIAGLVLGYLSLISILILPAMLLPALARAKERAQRIACTNNLKQLGIAFKIWSVDHKGEYVFNLSAKDGGTLELCARGPDGFERNGFQHLRKLSEEMGTPRILVCPGDKSKTAALSWEDLSPANISYQLRTGKEVNESNPQQILLICPIHGNVLMVDGSVQYLPQYRTQR
jgi:prepilin-type processing-associated H-X9-DG protein